MLTHCQFFQMQLPLSQFNNTNLLPVGKFELEGTLKISHTKAEVILIHVCPAAYFS